MQKCLQNLWKASVKKIYYCYETLVYLYTWMDINEMFAFEN